MILTPFDSLPTLLAGFPSPADDHLDPELDYNTLFKRTPNATVPYRIKGDSMIDAFLPHNSIAVVDRSITPKNNSIVAVTLDGESIVKHLVKTRDGHFLLPANRKYKSIMLNEHMDYKIWGTVTHVIIDVFKGKL